MDHCYGSDSYVWAEPNNGIIAFSLAGPVGDLIVYKSADNGATWEKKTAWQNPNKNLFYPFGENLEAPSGANSLVIDDAGICHLVFTGCSSNGGNYSNRFVSRAFYWNETMAPFTAPWQPDALDPLFNEQIHTESRLILEMSFIEDNFNPDKIVLYSPFGMIHKIHMAAAGPNRLIVVLAVQDHTTSHTSGFYFSRIFACSYIKDGAAWKFDTFWSNDLQSWGYPGWLRVNKNDHTNENCTHPQIVVEKTADDSGKFHIFFMVDDIPGGAIEGASDGSNNPQYNIYTDNYFVVYSDDVNQSVPTPPTIITTTLPNGREGLAYDQTLVASGTSPITWSLVSGELPVGLTLAETGKITGVPTEKHKLYEFVVGATNAVGDATKSLTIFIDSIVNNINTFENSPIMVYPNPVSDILYVVNKNQQQMQILLFDFLGREVLNQKVSGQAEFDISKLPAGIYSIRIQYGNTVENRKIVKK
jgi:hypothetical protein